ncbi:molybdopterin-dependent oxidoreductase [Salinisphaera orenii]|uniref:Ferredoxin n=1 Tax=Salinisphaera orenii YIM 95161 TaxID=1051139 RepID=A0A423PRC2_9GAMM|nr:molybdopterin-dependent oxidoreductase [Salinisphaera halophila]ROO28165.1 ferredoxin [Salinisphaera halophila YIM 95161]
MTHHVPGFCTLCRSRCGTLNSVDGDRLVAVTADPDHPTGQATCAKGRAAPELVHSRERILYPLKRTRPKGDADPGWQRIGWDEALAEIAEKLAGYRDRHGAESVAFSVTTPSGTPMSDSIDWVERFIRRYGSPNTIYATELCNWHKDVAHQFTFGCGMPVADYAQARLNILWGHNPSSVWLAEASRIADGQTEQVRRALLVVDPRATAHAKAADLWLRIRPGTDDALALGLSRLLLTGARFDDDFVRRWSNAPFLVDEASGRFLRAEQLDATGDGFVVWSQADDEPVCVDTREPMADTQAADVDLCGEHDIVLADGQTVWARPAFAHYRRACERWTLDRTAAATGLAPADILRAAEMIAEAGAAVSYHGWTGIGQHANASQTDRAIATLYALTGSFDRIGGNRIYGPLPINRVNDITLLEDAQRAKALGIDERPLGPPASGWVTAADVYDAVLEAQPYAVKALFGFGGNFLVSQPDVERGQRALEALNFHVHCDLFHTPTNAYADILLPISTPWEREGLRPGFEIDARAAGHVQLRPRMVAPRGEARADYDVAMDLACRLGMADDFFGGDIEAGWNHILAPLGLDVATLRAEPGGRAVDIDTGECKYARTNAKGEAAGFATPTRRVEFYSERLHTHGYSAVPQARAPLAPDTRRPLRLTTAKDGYYCHSQHRQISSLRKRSPDPRVALSTEAAADRGIVDGQWVALDGQTGPIRLKARVDDTLAADVVVADYGWWQACDDLGLPGAPIVGSASFSLNAAMDGDTRDPISGAIALRSARCDVRPLARRAFWPGYRSFRVAAIEREGDSVASVYLQPVDGAPLAGFRPGQHLPLRFVLADGSEVERFYSLSDAALDTPARYRISVKRLAATPDTAAGQVSTHINDTLREGDFVRARMPAGRFTLPTRHDAPIVLIAGGIGITPFLSLLETLAATNTTDMPEIHLIYANRNSATHAFAERLRELKGALARLDVVDIYSEPLPGDERGRDYDADGYVDGRIIPADWIDRRARFYLCGPTPMMSQVRDMLTARGVFGFEIFSEAFTSPAPVNRAGLAAQTVTLKRSGKSFTWTPDSASILDSADAEGIELPSGCRAGQCESCALKLVAGRVHTAVDTGALDDDICLTCQAVPLTAIELDA